MALKAPLALRAPVALKAPLLSDANIFPVRDERFNSASIVLLQQPDTRVRVAIDDRFLDGFVFAPVIASTIDVLEQQMSITICALGKNLAKRDQRSQLARAIQGLMEGIVAPFPFGIELSVSSVGCPFREFMKSRDDVGFPLIVARGNRHPNRQPFELAAAVCDIECLFG